MGDFDFAHCDWSVLIDVGARDVNGFKVGAADGAAKTEGRLVVVDVAGVFVVALEGDAVLVLPPQDFPIVFGVEWSGVNAAHEWLRTTG